LIAPCRASDGLKHEVHVDWFININQEKPQLEIKAVNYDFYDLSVNEIQLENITIYDDGFTVKGNKSSELTIEDVSKILDREKDSLLLEIYIDGAKMEPSYKAEVDIDYNKTEEESLGEHRSYGAFTLLQHNVSSQLPSWLEEGKEMEYEVYKTNSTGIFNYTLRMAIAEYFPDNSTITLAIQREGNGVNTEAVRMSAHYHLMVSWLNPSHIQIIKEKSTSFINTLYNYRGEEEIEIPIGKFQCYNIRTTQPYFADGIKGEIWVEKNSGVLLRSKIQYVGGRTENRTLTDTNILRGTNGSNIPGFPIESIIIGTVTIITIILIYKKQHPEV
ncbi:MAG: Loki-CTERM sorting domain-containing protein, partial [archaeon]